MTDILSSIVDLAQNISQVGKNVLTAPEKAKELESRSKTVVRLLSNLNGTGRLHEYPDLLNRIQSTLQEIYSFLTMLSNASQFSRITQSDSIDDQFDDHHQALNRHLQDLSVALQVPASSSTITASTNAAAASQVITTTTSQQQQQMPPSTQNTTTPPPNTTTTTTTTSTSSTLQVQHEKRGALSGKRSKLKVYLDGNHIGTLGQGDNLSHPVCLGTHTLYCQENTLIVPKKSPPQSFTVRQPQQQQPSPTNIITALLKWKRRSLGNSNLDPHVEIVVTAAQSTTSSILETYAPFLDPNSLMFKIILGVVLLIVVIAVPASVLS